MYDISPKMTTRKTMRTTVPKMSFYESDQEDNLKDEDYFPYVHEHLDYKLHKEEEVEEEEEEEEMDEDDDDDDEDYVPPTRSCKNFKKMPQTPKPQTKEKQKKLKKYLEEVSAKEKMLSDRKTNGKRKALVKIEARNSKRLHRPACIEDERCLQAKNDRKRYLLEIQLLQDKIAEIDREWDGDDDIVF